MKKLLILVTLLFFFIWIVEKFIPTTTNQKNAYTSVASNNALGIDVSQENTTDRLAITTLITSWAHFRDRGKWDDLKSTFWPGGTISLSWYDGDFSGFVEASQAMTNRGNTSRHVIYTPYIQINNNLAVAETNATLSARANLNVFKIDLTGYIRFYDFLEKRDGIWKIVKRVGIYEVDRIDPVSPSILFYAGSFFIDVISKIKQFPESCKYLAFALDKEGYPVMENIVEDKSEAMQSLYDEGAAWLNQIK